MMIWCDGLEVISILFMNIDLQIKKAFYFCLKIAKNTTKNKPSCSSGNYKLSDNKKKRICSPEQVATA